MRLVELLDVVESDVVGEFNVAYDAARASVQRVRGRLHNLPAMFMSQGHIVSAEWVSNVGMCGHACNAQLQLLAIMPCPVGS